MHAAVSTAATVSTVPCEALAPPDNLRAAKIAQHLVAARARVDALTEDLCGAQLSGPKREIVNPALWEIGHVAWFQEYWCLRSRQDGTRAPSMLGKVWERTASTFEPYPGFVPDLYAEYSTPWFGSRRVLRGGSFAMPQRLVRNTWRAFFTPGRDGVFAGFRTCALAE